MKLELSFGHLVILGSSFNWLTTSNEIKQKFFHEWFNGLAPTCRYFPLLLGAGKWYSRL